MVENVPTGLSPVYCHCSVGYVKEMFEQATGKSIQVALKESLKRGGKACRFHI
jgi:predicted hydrocarbon binding protein